MPQSTNTQRQFPPESAGRLATRHVPIVPLTATVRDVEDLFRDTTRSFVSTDLIYVIDHTGKLRGGFPVHTLYQHAQTARVADIMTEELITARPRTDQEHVALLALRHTLKEIPVIDKDGIFIGAVTSETILNILHSESAEDALRLSGTSRFDNAAVDIISASTGTHIRKRLPWLILGLGGGVLAAIIVQLFEGTLKEHIVLAAFIPAVVYMADAVGAQAQILFIRSMALIERCDVRTYVMREFKISLVLSILLGGLASGFASIWLNSILLGLVFGTSIMATILAAIVVAVCLPLILHRMRFDPAIASGPFATVVRDIMSLLIYFSIASFMF